MGEAAGIAEGVCFGEATSAGCGAAAGGSGGGGASITHEAGPLWFS